MTTTSAFRLLRARPWLAGCVLAMATTVARAEVVVIVNLDSPVQALSVRQVSDFYLGRTRDFPGGHGALIVEQTREARTREDFYRSLNGMSLKQLNAYWARLQFSGEIQPPRVAGDSRAVLNYVRANGAAIGYVDAAVVDASVRVVLRLKD